MLNALVKNLRAAVTGVSIEEEDNEKQAIQAQIKDSYAAVEATRKVLEGYTSHRPSWESITVTGKGSRMRRWELPVDEFLLIMIGCFLLFKALIFRRETSLGRKLAVSNLILSITYFGAALSLSVPFFQTDYWRIPLLIFLFSTTLAAAIEVVEILGGLPGAWREAKAAWQELQDAVYDLTIGIVPAHPSGDGEALRGAVDALFVLLVWLLLVLGWWAHLGLM